jgi:hypothetical protein
MRSRIFVNDTDVLDLPARTQPTGGGQLLTTRGARLVGSITLSLLGGQELSEPAVTTGSAATTGLPERCPFRQCLACSAQPCGCRQCRQPSSRPL